MSHLSITSLSQIYNQNLRLKFGSAPAQLLTKGEQAERSIEKRASAIKKQFDMNNNVSAKSQLSQKMISKQAMQGTVSSCSWNKSKSQSVNGILDKNFKTDHLNDSDDDNDDNDIVSPINEKIRMITASTTSSSLS